MVKWIIAAMLLLPVAEIAVFVVVAWAIGFGWAMLLMLATSAAGLVVLRRAGRTRLARFRVAVTDSDMTGFEAQTGGVLAVLAGILLLLPGFVTDLAGALLLIGPLRRRCANAFHRMLKGFQPAGRSRREVLDLAPDQWTQVPDPKLKSNGDRKRR